MKEIKVLNHGHVRLVDSMGSDLSVVRSARVSYDAEWRAGEDEGKDAKLIDYLVRNHHTSPLESVQFTFDVKAPLFVFRQWHRHRTWCLAGDSRVEFVRPCDGKPYKVSIRKLAESWNPGAAKRRRKDQSPLSLQEHNRERIMGMRAVCRNSDGTIGYTRITDVWQSGEKEVFEVVTSHRKITASADHKFFSEGRWVPVSELSGKRVCTFGLRGANSQRPALPTLTKEELAEESWVEFAEGYRVSNLGRVQSSWGQGRRFSGNQWLDKKSAVRRGNRLVVSFFGKTEQISRLVAKSFLPTAQDDLLVRHLNDNPMDNRASNLAWGSNADNQQDSIRNGTRAGQGWVDELVLSVTPVGVQPVYDLTVEHDEHNFVANNFLVHNCYNEVSARYSQLPEEFYVPDVSQITTQSTSNKQMRTDEVHPEAEALQRAVLDSCADSFALYKRMIARGMPRELARGVLPVNTYSHMFATVDLHNLAHFLRLRLHEHSQYEIRVYAQAMLDLIEPVVPVTVAALKKHTLGI